MHSCGIWKSEGNGSHASATSVVSVGKCHREVPSSPESTPVFRYQLRSVEVRAWVSIFGSADLAGSADLQCCSLVLWQRGQEGRVPQRLSDPLPL